jgi:outer membrane protein assembly factor BamB
MPFLSSKQRVAYATISMASALAFLFASCGQAPREPDVPKTPRRTDFNLAQAENQDAWGEVSNPGRTASMPAEPAPGDWPGFRGPHRDGRADGVTFDLDWDTNPPKELWRKRVGDGRSSFAAIGAYVFTQEQRGPNETVVCYEAESGEEVWVNAIPERFHHRQQGDGPRATPTFAHGNLFTQGATGVLQCLDAATGETVWQRNLLEETGAKVPHFGFSNSPLVVNDLVIVFAGGPDGKGLAAYNAESGAPVWSAGQSDTSYASPQLARFGDMDQVVMVSNFGVEGLEPATGAVLWNHALPPKKFARCIQPVLTVNNGLIFGTPPRLETRRINVATSDGSWTGAEDWTRDGFAPYFNDAVYYNGSCYGSHRRNLECIDVATGEEQWRAREFGGQMIVLPAMDAVFSLSEKGDVMIFKASAARFEKLASIPGVLPGEPINHPVIAHGRLFLRNDVEAVCYALHE